MLDNPGILEIKGNGYLNVLNINIEMEPITWLLWEVENLRNHDTFAYLIGCALFMCYTCYQRFPLTPLL